MRGRKPGPDIDKIALIVHALKLHPQGLWTRQIARLTGLKKSTVSLYLNSHLKDEVEDVHNTVQPIRIVKLKETAHIPDYVS